MFVPSNVALQEQTQSRNVLAALKNDPLGTLSQNRLQVSLVPGHQTQLQRRTPFEYNMGNIGIGAGVLNTNRRIYVDAIVTPTRARNSPNRFNALQRIPGAPADLWITERQTGCSVLILDWGGQYSMVHLAPHVISSYNQVAQFVMNSSLFLYAEAQRASLKPEMTQVVNASKIGGANPHSYIFIQSNHAAINMQSLNLIGIKNNVSWSFYLQQIIPPSTMNVKLLSWTSWCSLAPYLTY